MKRIFYILGISALVFSCSVEEIHHPSEADTPAASKFEPVISVDQETNQVTFSLPQGSKGVIPVWILQDKNGDFTTYAAQDGLSKIFTSAGDYKVRLQIMNAAGVSPDYVEKSFHIDNTIVNFDRYLRFLAGTASKVWRIDNAAPAHLGCGPSGTTGTEWYSANPDEKASVGLYDNRLTFSTDYGYTFDPGESGTLYVNTGVTVAPYGSVNPNDGVDFTAPVDEQTATFSFEVSGDDLYLVLPEGTRFPYIPNAGFIKDPRFRVESMDNNTMTLVNDNGEIAWHFILTSKAGVVVFNGFKYDADSNIWKPADAAHTYSYYYAPGWNQLPNPDAAQNGNAYTLNLPSATSDQWQAQFFIIPDAPVSLSAGMQYDFSCIVSSSTDLPGMTFKLTDTSDDGNFLFTERLEIKGGEDYVFYRSGLEGIDASAVKMVFDFGGNPENTEVTISRITLKDHAIDDGTVLPDGGGEGGDEPEEGAHYDISGATNLWRSATITNTYWYADGGWAQIADPETEALEFGGLKVTVPAGIGGSEWQGQTVWHTDIPASASELYDFCVTIDSEEDATLTVKLAWEGNDNDHSFFYKNDVAVKAGEPLTFKMPSIVPDTDYDKIVLFIDCGRSPVGNVITFKDFCFQLHQEPQGGGDKVVFVYDSPGNLWKPADAAHTYSYYYAPNWTQLDNPEAAQNGNAYTLNLPSATFDQWQAQFFIIPDAPVSLSAEKSYDFQVILNSSTDHGNITLKLTDTTDDGNYLFTNMVTADAYEDMVYRFTNLKGIDAEAVKMVFDFGRNLDNTEITIKEIILQEHVAGSGGGDEPEPGPGPEPEVDVLDVTGAGNLWRKAVMTNTFWYADAGWSQIADPLTFSADDFGGLKVIIPHGIGGSEWQGQTVWHTDIPAEAGESYDFGFTVNSDEDIYAMTVKLAWEGNDNDHAFFYENSISVKARETFKFRMTEIVPDTDYDKIVLFIDLGRCKRGTAVSFTDFGFQQHGTWFDTAGDSNLWNKATMTNTFWYADGNWSQIGDPATEALENHGLKVTIPVGVGGAEWQGQTVWHTDIPAAAAQSYDFCMRILSEEDAVLTVKLAWEGNDNDHAFFYENSVAVEAGKPMKFKKVAISPDADYDKIVLFVDCGRCAPGSVVSFDGFCFQEHKD